jgi:hypothetical protein
MVVRYLRVVLGFTAFFTAFFSPALFGGNMLTVTGDGSNIALPAYLVPHGLWEPDIMLGYPWASNFNGFWDPLFLLHLIPHSFNAYMLCAYVIAATGAFGCVDALTGSTAGGLVAGVSYALGGFMIGHLGHYDVVHPAAWTPYVFWALIVQRRAPGRLPIALGSIAIGLCALAGQPQVLAYTLLFAAAYVVAGAFGTTQPRRFVFGATATLVLGIGLAAVALVPGIVLALASFRAQASLDYFLAYSVPVWQLPIRLLMPYVVGQSAQPLYSMSATGDGPDAEYSGYVGIVTLLLALVAVIVRRDDRNVIFFAVAALAGLVLCAGDGFHIAALTFHIPGFNLFRAQGRNLLEFTVFASILGGVGAAELSRGNVAAKQLAFGLALIGAGFVATAIVAQRMGAIASAADAARNPAVLIPLALLVLAAAVATLVQRAPAPRLAATALVVCTVLDLTSFAWFEYWRTPVGPSVVAAPPAAVTLHAELERTHQRLFSVAGGTAQDGIPPNLSLVWGVPAAGGYVQLLLTSPGIFLQLLPQGTIAPAVLLGTSDRSIDLAAIRYIVIPPSEVDAALAARPEWRRIATTTSGTILENTRAEPRVRIVHRVIAMAPDDTLHAIRTGAIDVHTVALVGGTATLDTRPDAGDAAVISALDADGMTVNVRCASACFLRTSDTYNGMWNARIDGAPVPLTLTDYALRGVFVAAGTHTVTFAYRPWTIALGLALTVFSGGLIVALAASSLGSDPRLIRSRTERRLLRF